MARNRVVLVAGLGLMGLVKIVTRCDDPARVAARTASEGVSVSRPAVHATEAIAVERGAVRAEEVALEAAQVGAEAALGEDE